MAPGHRPRTTTSRDRDTKAHADTNAAPRRSSGTSAICASSSAVFAGSSPCRPDQRADSTPGIPFSASTSSPESSATEARPDARNASRALANAFSSNVAPVSGASSKGATSSSDNSFNATPAVSSTRRNSASFFGLRLATNNSVTAPTLETPLSEKAASARGQGCVNPGKQLMNRMHGGGGGAGGPGGLPEILIGFVNGALGSKWKV